MENEYEHMATFFHAAIKEIAATEQPSNTKVLDFGTGKGRLVCSFLAIGYDAYGCDIKPYWQNMLDADVDRLSIISLAPYRLPYPDNMFDCVVSSSVLEHAQNKEELFLEICRVLKNGGFAMHLYPGKWYLPAEPHIYVPLVNFFWPKCPKWWLSLWAFLGIRNEFQREKSWKEVVNLNFEYCKQGLSYLSNSEYRALSIRIFGNYSAPMEFYIKHSYGGFAKLFRQLPFQRLTGRMGGEIRMNFIVQRKLSPNGFP